MAKRNTRQLDYLFNAIKIHMKKNNGQSPTLAKITELMRYTSTGVARNRLIMLEKRGDIKVSEGNRIELVGGIYLTPEEAKKVQEGLNVSDLSEFLTHA